jgi:N-methylhydantoinase A
MTAPLRVGIDVGGTFTKAAAVDPRGGRLLATAEVPTTHSATGGVSEGTAAALARLLDELAAARDRVEYVAFSTTQAMNALLEGDVARVGVVGIGAAPDLRPARKRTRIGAVDLAPGRQLRTEHEFLDATRGLSATEVDEALSRLAASGCEAIAVSGAFAVDGPECELLVARRAAELGLPCCSGHELSGAYGLETRTVSAAINAAILPVVETAATVVQAALSEAGIRVPLLVPRGDGGAMGSEAFRRRPSFTVGSGPAAGVAAALQALGVVDALVIECGGTSSNVSVVRGGRPVLRSIRVMGRPTAIRSVDSWVVGAAGGSMTRVGKRKLIETGPRSAHVASVPYACFTEPVRLAGAELVTVAPRPGDPTEYAVVRRNGEDFALTATCAANALGLVADGTHPQGDREAATLAFEALGRRLRKSSGEAAEALLGGAVEKIAEAAAEAARAHDLGEGVPIVALGGAAAALAPRVADRLGREMIQPDDAEVLSAIGAAMSLVRAEVERSPRGLSDDEVESRRLQVARDAEHECVEAGAAPPTVSVETNYDSERGVLRAVATGAVALEAGSAGRRPASIERQRQAAARALGSDERGLDLLAANDFYRVFTDNGSGRVAIVDALCGIACSEERARRVLSGEGTEFLEQLGEAVDDVSVNLGVGSLLPRVTIVCGSRLADLSDARNPSEVTNAAARLIAEQPGNGAVAVVAR